MIRWLLGLSAFVVILAVFAPEDRVNMVKELWRRLMDAKAQACVEFVRRSAHDPESVRLRLAEPRGDRHLVLVYTARNALGGTVQEWVECAFDGDRVNVADTLAIMERHR